MRASERALRKQWGREESVPLRVGARPREPPPQSTGSLVGLVIGIVIAVLLSVGACIPLFFYVSEAASPPPLSPPAPPPAWSGVTFQTVVRQDLVDFDEAAFRTQVASAARVAEARATAERNGHEII